VAADYVRSDDAIEATLRYVRDVAPEHAKLSGGVTPPALFCDPATIVHVLGAMTAEHGSTGGFVRSLGVSDATVDQLGVVLVERSP
jgi:hypothetical protein